ncbi:MAG: co-chaperone GroES [Proteobacteria bacterium]|nr:MAG: co-chaperone GroES [Pseudomonadota bacterium]
MKFRPLQDRVLVKPLAPESKTASGIIIPDNSQEKPAEGAVVGVGNGKVLDSGKVLKPDLKEGDRVIYSKYSGSEIKIDGQEHIILRESDILAVYTK